MLARVGAVLSRRHAQSRVLQAELDFGAGCALLELNEAITGGLTQPPAIMQCVDGAVASA